MFDRGLPRPHSVCLAEEVSRPWADRPLRPAPETPSLAVWRRHMRSAPALTRMPEGAPFEPAVLDRMRAALTRLGDLTCTLIYVTSGYQPDYRSPVLPHLLGALPAFGAVFALREGAGPTPDLVETLTQTALRAGEGCLVVRDRSPRLSTDAPAAQSAAALRFTLLTPLPAKGSSA